MQVLQPRSREGVAQEESGQGAGAIPQEQEEEERAGCDQESRGADVHSDSRVGGLMEQLPDPGVDHIVAEVTKNWGNVTPKVELRYGGPVEREPDTLSMRFEHVWLANVRRGFQIKDWQFSTVLDPGGKVITETVVALFERAGRESSFEEELKHLTSPEGGDAVE